MCLFTQLVRLHGWVATYGFKHRHKCQDVGRFGNSPKPGLTRIAQKDAALTSSSPILLLFIIIFQVEVTVRSHDRVEVS